MNSLIIEALEENETVDLDLKSLKVPNHIAIIMDGNRRWAKNRGLPPIVGHWKGAENLTRIVRAASNLGVKILTVYAFSTENWGRSPEEVSALMHLFKVYLNKQRKAMIQEGVRLDAIGDLSLLPQDLQESIAESKIATSKGEKIDLVLALNYGGRDDIRRAMVSLLDDYKDGAISKADISEKMIASRLDTAKWPDPEILIRTSGEKRQSNFLLWQLSYSEFYHTDVLWPSFNEKELLKAIREYQYRERRFGGL